MEQTEIDKLIASYCAGRLLREEAAELNRWLKESRDNQRYFRNCTARYSGESSLQAQQAWMKFATKNKELFAQPRPDAGRRRIAWISGFAAAALLAFGIVILTHPQRAVPEADLLAQAAESPREYRTECGERMDVTLPDGTTVCLNSEARLVIADDFGKTTREIQFDGEGFFNVAKDPQRPFIIHSAETDYTVLGTSFNLQSYSREHFAVVTLHTGCLQAKVRKDVIVLDPNEELQIDSDNNMISKREVRVDDSIGWMSGRLAFTGLPLRDVANKLSRHFQVKINVHSEISHQQYTGVVDDETLAEALNMIVTTSPARISITEIDGEYFLSRTK